MKEGYFHKKPLSKHTKVNTMDTLGKILKWIVIWTAILFVPIFAFGVLATIIVAVGLGAVASGGTMIALAVMFFLSPPVLTVWAIGVAVICLGNLLGRRRAEKQTIN